MHIQCIEYWRAVPDLEHLEASYCGKVRSVQIRVNTWYGTRKVKEKVLKQGFNSCGYLRVSCKRKPKLVHRIIALAFCPGHEAGLTVNHINGIKTDNRASNLEWMSQRKNYDHAMENDLTAAGVKNANAILTDQDVVRIRKRWNGGNGQSQTAIAAQYDVSASTVHLIVQRKYWRHIPED